MKSLELNASKREITGKRVRFLRREGKTPANLYGHGLDSTALEVDTRHLQQTVARAGKTDLVSLKIDGAKTPRKVLIREIQKDPITEELLHVDLFQVKLTEKLKADIPLAFIGEAPVLKKKNISLLYLIDSLHIEALPDALPHSFEIDLSNLEETDQAIYIKDIPIGEELTLLSDPEQMVVKVTETRREAEVTEEEEAVEEEEAAPEVEAEAEAEPAAEE